MIRTLYILLMLSVCHVVMAGRWCPEPLAATSAAAGTAVGDKPARLADRYSVDNPLIYEDTWNKAPYTYLDSHGMPSGYCVELVTKIMRRLRIPFVIRLHSQHIVRQNMESGASDLSIGEPGINLSTSCFFGKETVSTLNACILMRAKDAPAMVSQEDIRNRPLVFSNITYSADNLRRHGIADSLFTMTSDMGAEILQEVAEDSPHAVWNGIMMNWVLKKYGLQKDYKAVPIDVPCKELRFMSKDVTLLNSVDSIYKVLKREGEVERLTTKWLYPERNVESDMVFNVIMALTLFIIIVIVAFIIGRRYNRRYTHSSLADIRSQMNLVLQFNKINVWVYFPKTRRYAWMTPDGEVKQTYSSFEFSRFYPDGNFNIIHTHVTDLLTHDDDHVTEFMHCRSLTEPDKIIDVEVRILPLHDEYGKTYLICGLQSDITDSKSVLFNMRLLRERYRTAFKMAHCTVMRFDSDKVWVDINDIGRERLGITDTQRFFAERYTMDEISFMQGLDIDNAPIDLRFTHRVKNGDTTALRYATSKYFKPKPYAFKGYLRHPNETVDSGLQEMQHSKTGYYYVHFLKNVDNNDDVISYMLFIHDRTDEVDLVNKLRERRRDLNELREGMDRLYHRLKYTLSVTGIWLVTYDTAKKELTVYDDSMRHKPPFTQISLLEMLDSAYTKKIFRVFRKLDQLKYDDISLDVKTYLVNEKGENRHFHFDLCPLFDTDGSVMLYYGTCRDTTAAVYARESIKQEMKRMQEAELLKVNFLKNTSYSLRQPLVSISQNIRALYGTLSELSEKKVVSNIKSDIRRLTQLSDDTMLLSRIEAGLQKLTRKPVNFGQFYRETVESAINKYRSAAVTYNVQDTYDDLVLYVDVEMMRRVIYELVSLSARHTRIGMLTVRYVYHSGRLILSVEDTGQGLPPDIYSRIYEPHISSNYNMHGYGRYLSGLEIPICKALVDMVGGVLDIESEPGRGINSYVQLDLEKFDNAGTFNVKKDRNIVG